MSDSDRPQDLAPDAAPDEGASGPGSEPADNATTSTAEPTGLPAGHMESTDAAARDVRAEGGGEPAEPESRGDSRHQSNAALVETTTIATVTDELNTPKIAKCLWCGSERPVDIAICPSCEHAWVDATIDEARHGRLDSVAPGAPQLPPPRPWWRRRWIPVALAASAVAIYGMVFWVLWDNTGSEQPVAATTQLPVATTQETSSPADTTAPPATSEPPATTLPATTTTSTTTTTTQPPIAIVEPPYDPAALTLGAFALGPIRFGSTDPDVPGRLAATFGQPRAQFEVGESWGLCPTETGRVLEFGSLSLILRSGPDGDAVAGYRLRAAADGSNQEDPTAALKSISGLGLGDPLSRATALYSIVETTELADGTPIYLVLRSSDRRTLLWGALSDADDPEVTSINSPRPCDGGPFGP